MCPELCGRPDQDHGSACDQDQESVSAESGLVCVGGCEPCAVLEWSWVKDSALGEKFRARKVCDGLGEDAWQKLTVTL